MAKREDLFVQILTSDLRALLFWAAIGMRHSNGGAYERKLPEILADYAEQIRFKFDPPNAPVWGADVSARAEPTDG